MKITSEEFTLIKELLSKQRSNVTISNLQVIKSVFYVAEQGCKWRVLPKKFGNWSPICTRMNRWAKQGVLDDVFAALQANNATNIQIEYVSSNLLTFR